MAIELTWLASTITHFTVTYFVVWETDWYRDSAANTTEENSSISSLIRMR